jgi:hypothetical protein
MMDNKHNNDELDIGAAVKTSMKVSFVAGNILFAVLYPQDVWLPVSALIVFSIFGLLLPWFRNRKLSNTKKPGQFKTTF